MLQLGMVCKAIVSHLIQLQSELYTWGVYEENIYTLASVLS